MTKPPIRLDIDTAPESAAYIPWAKRMLERLRASIPWGGTRYYDLGSTKVTLWWTTFIDKIRITTAALAFGFIQASKTGPSASIKGVIDRAEGSTELTNPSYPASDLVPPFSEGSTPSWNKNRTTAVFSATGAESGATHIYHAGIVYEPEWNTPALGAGSGSTSVVYMSNDGLTIVMLRTWGNVLTSGQPAVVYNRLEWDDTTDPENPTWNETYFQPDISGPAALIASPPGSAVYMTGSGWTPPHFRLTLDPGFPGTITGGAEVAEQIGVGPYGTLFPGQTAGQSDHILFRGHFAIPVSQTLLGSGFVWSAGDLSTNPPTWDSNDGRVEERVTYYSVIWRTFSFFYKLNLLTGVTTEVWFNESEFTRYIKVFATNSAAEDDPEVYPDGIETGVLWETAASPTTIFCGDYGTLPLASQGFALWPPAHNRTSPTGQVNFGGSTLTAFVTTSLGVATASGTPIRFWTGTATYGEITGYNSVVGAATLVVYRDNSNVVNEALDLDQLSAINGFPLYTGSKTGIVYHETDAPNSIALREYFNWDPITLPELGDIQVQNSATAKYQHEQISDFDIPETEYTMYEDEGVIDSFTAASNVTVMVHAEDDEKWYIDHPVDGPGKLREYERAEDPDTLLLVVDYEELTYPTSLTFDSVEYPNNAFVRPFMTLGEGRTG